MLDKKTQEILSKPLLGGASAVILSRLLQGFSQGFIGETSMTNHFLFGGAVTAGLLVADLTAPHVIPNNHAKVLETRILETGLATASSLIADRYAFPTSVVGHSTFTKVAIIVASEMSGEYFSEMIWNKSMV
jgi:hypothetical protein